MSINDNGIIDTLKESPERGFRMLMMKYQEPLYWHIRRLVVSHDDAQDAAQETFVRIYRSFDQYRGDCSFRSWIYRIATNEALRIISKRRQEVVSLESAATGGQFIAGENYIDRNRPHRRFHAFQHQGKLSCCQRENSEVHELKRLSEGSEKVIKNRFQKIRI